MIWLSLRKNAREDDVTDHLRLMTRMYLQSTAHHALPSGKLSGRLDTHEKMRSDPISFRA